MSRVAAVQPEILPEPNARRTLLFGVVTLAVGIALVGTGADKEGALPVLAGMLLTIFGIHTYGRLGPDSVEEDDARRAAAMTEAWRGGLVAVAGLAVVLGGQPTGFGAIAAYLAIAGGALACARGARARSRGTAAQPAPRRRAARSSRKK